MYAIRSYYERSANVDAVNHFTAAIKLLQTLPDTPERRQQELSLHVALGAPLTATKSWAAPEVEQVYLRARELCEEMGDVITSYSIHYTKLYDRYSP